MVNNYNMFYFSPLNESEGMTQGNMDYFLELGEIDIYDDNLKSIITVEAKDFVKVVTDAMFKISSEYKFLYWYIRYSKVFFIPNYPSEMGINTMAVDNNKNLWMNVHFIYNQCKMDKNKVFGILFHELMHNFLKHVQRSKEMYPEGMTEPLRMKCNICTDFEVNSSMVEDGIVDENFWKEMNGMYKKEYAGMRWEDILRQHGDEEYEDWLKRNGMHLSEKTKKSLEAIEEASKVLRDPDSTDAEKDIARDKLKKKMDELFGKRVSKKKVDKADLKGIIRELEKLMDTMLGEIGDLVSHLQNVADDLMVHPKDMDESEVKITINDIKGLTKELLKNNSEIARTFHKTEEQSKEDIKKSKISLAVALNSLHKGVEPREERKVCRQAKDDLEALILDEVGKKRREEKREEAIKKHKEKLEKEKLKREKSSKKGLTPESGKSKEEKRKEKIEKLKKKNPIKKFVDTFTNLAELVYIDRIGEETYHVIVELNDTLTKLCDISINDIVRSDIKGVDRLIEKLRILFDDDLHNLVDREIIDWDKMKIKMFVKEVFDALDAFFKVLLDEDEPSSVKFGAMSNAVGKLRSLGKVLKTQKKIKPTEEWKKGYEGIKSKLLNIYKKHGKEALKAELRKHGVDC